MKTASCSSSKDHERGNSSKDSQIRKKNSPLAQQRPGKSPAAKDQKGKSPLGKCEAPKNTSLTAKANASSKQQPPSPKSMSLPHSKCSSEHELTPQRNDRTNGFKSARENAKLSKKSSSSNPPLKVRVTVPQKGPRTKSAPSGLRRTSELLKQEYSCSSVECESVDSQLKQLKSSSAPSLPSSHSSGEDASVVSKSSAKLQKSTRTREEKEEEDDLRRQLEARIASLSSAPQSVRESLSLFVVDSPLQCHPPLSTPVSSDNEAMMMPLVTSDSNYPDCSDGDPICQKYMKVSLCYL